MTTQIQDVMSDRVDVMLDIVDLTSYIQWCNVIKSGFDVICCAYGVKHIEDVMTYIHFFT